MRCDWTQVMATDGDDTNAASVDVKLTAMVDDYNTAVIKYEEEALATGEFVAEIDEAYFTTDWAGALGLDQMAPIGLDSAVGYWEYADQDVSSVTGLGYEDVDDWFGSVETESWAYQVVVSAMDMVNLQITVDPGPGPDG